MASIPSGVEYVYNWSRICILKHALFVLLVSESSQQCSSHVGTISWIPVFNQYLAEDKVSCSRHNAVSNASLRTPDLRPRFLYSTTEPLHSSKHVL